MKIVNCLHGEISNTPPIWIMRQAGRYLPEYREVRSTAENFISFCLDSNKAAEVTLQPLKRFNLDAAIIFSDILMIPWVMKRDVRFIPGTGPVLNPLSEDETIYNPDSAEIREKLNPVSQALKKVRSSLDTDKALIGFSGAPWTLLTYMVEGGSSRDFAQSRELLYRNPKRCDEIIDMLTTQIVEFLSMQAESGANILKIFDSWAGAVPAEHRHRLVEKPHQNIITQLRAKGITQPVITFPKGLGEGIIAYADKVDMNGLALDHMTDISWAHKNLRSKLPIQGNLDPMAVVAGGDEMHKSVDAILDAISDRPHIFNFGHGIVPQTPIAHVEELVNRITSSG